MSSIVPITEIPTISLLYKLGRLRPPSGPVTSLPSANESLNNKICLIRNDITKLRVDAIVNAANKSLLGGGGVDGAIHKAAGPGLIRECETLGGCSTGSAKITDAYDLPCKKVIHAVGPVYRSAKKTNSHATLLGGCYRQSLELAVEHRLKSIAFSALSTGIYGYPSEEAAETALAEVKNFLEGVKGRELDKVVFCTFEKKDEDAYIKWIPSFFPPSPDPQQADAKSEDQTAAESESPVKDSDLPDPPTQDPSVTATAAAAAATDEPPSKRAKLDEKEEDQNDDHEWHTLETDGQSAENGTSSTTTTTTTSPHTKSTGES